MPGRRRDPAPRSLRSLPSDPSSSGCIPLCPARRHDPARLLVLAQPGHQPLPVRRAGHIPRDPVTTAGRVGAILDLTWDRVDMLRGQINLRADAEGPRKGRAIVPMNGLSRPALLAAEAASLSDYVIEWAGGPVKSIRKGFTRTVERAGLTDVTPHVLRHTAAVYMAEGGVPMQKISQYLGHSSTAVTERTYARFAPDHLR
ncbi:hypothetical protein FGG78_22395, partial [Thioclava sp. BHET1]